MGRHRAVAWALTAVYAVGLAVLVPCAFLLADYLDGRTTPRRSGDEYYWIRVAFDAGFVVSPLLAGVITYRQSSGIRNIVIRWFTTVMAAAGGTILLCSVWLLVIGLTSARSPLSAAVLAMAAFMFGSFLAGAEGFLLTGLWTAVVLGCDRVIARRWVSDVRHVEAKSPGSLVYLFAASGVVALFYSVAGGGRIARALMKLFTAITSATM